MIVSGTNVYLHMRGTKPINLKFVYLVSFGRKLIIEHPLADSGLIQLIPVQRVLSSKSDPTEDLNLI